jgi:ubiquinone/menaquinone biosynthesis C-methylase UbiE
MVAMQDTADSSSGFDRLGRVYAWMERCFAGPFMQRCRTAHLQALRGASPILMLGEGPGRFLQTTLKAHPDAQILCVDGSASMLDQARNVAAQLHATSRVTFEQHDLLHWTPSPESFAALTTHFFLDCFTESQLQELIPRLAGSLKTGGLWIVSDFHIPRGVMQFPARVLLGMLYAFFRRTTGIAANRLVDPEPYLRKSGLVPESSKPILGGILVSALWRKPASPAEI